MSGPRFETVTREAAWWFRSRNTAHCSMPLTKTPSILRRILDDPDQDWVPADVVSRLAAGENAVASGVSIAD